MDAASQAYTRIFSPKGTTQDIHFYPVDTGGKRVSTGHILRSYPITLSRYAAGGYWAPDVIRIGDRNENERYSTQTDFGWKLYIDNPLSDCEPPAYVPNSMRLSLSEAKTANGERYQVVTARWRVIEANAIDRCRVRMNDEHPETYSLVSRDGGYASNGEIDEVTTDIIIPDYRQSGIYTVVLIRMSDVAGNSSGIYFSELPSYNVAGEDPVLADISQNR